MATAIWTPLNPGKREIRLAHVAPNDDIEKQPSCWHEIVSLDDEPQYEALSYAWGDLNVTQPIELHATQWPVTANLESALRHLRRSTEWWTVWIDAICIDQTNIEEKNHQVPFMKTIYSKAEVVRAWLGEAACGSDNIMATIHKFGHVSGPSDLPISPETFASYAIPMSELLQGHGGRELGFNKSSSLPERRCFTVG